MKSFKFYLLLLLLVASVFSPRVGYSQAESHNFTTYDTVISFSSGTWLLRISRDTSAGAPARPAIITQPGQGEMGNGTSDLAPLSLYGPHYWTANGWDGSVVLGNGTHYPMLFTCVYTTSSNPRTIASCDLIDYLLSHYNINPHGVHLAGLSQGSFNWTSMMCLERSPGDRTYAKKVTSLVAMSGFATNLVDSMNSPYYWWSTEDTNMYKIWAAEYGGHYFGTEGYNDVTRNTWKGAQAMNDTLPGAKPGYFSYNTVDGGNHGGWNTIYDPSNTDWRTDPSSTKGPYYSPSQPPPFGAGGVDVQGNYNYPENLFQWMLRQGDTTMVTGGSTTTSQPPTVSAGSAQTITLPTSTATLTGTVTDANGGLTYAWTQVSGPSTATIATANAVSATVSALRAGTYVFQLTATDAASLTASNTVQVVVNPNTSVAPTVSAGAAQTVTLPTSTATLVGTATPATGTTIASYAWTQTSGPSATIASPTAVTTTISGLAAGTSVFQLTVTSSTGVTATSTVTITVNAAVVTGTPPPTLPGGLYVKKVITCEYRVWYIASDNNVYTWNNGSLNVQQFAIGGRQAVDGAGAFNEFRVLDDQGYIWTSKIDYTTNTTRYDTDTSGNPFNNNASVYAYGNTTVTIKTDGSVWLFGSDTLHLFHSTGAVNMSPMQLSPAGMVFKKLVIGNRLVGLCTDGSVWEWTYGNSTPVKKNIPAPAIDIFGSHLDYFGCIIPTTTGATSGYPYVWGNANGAWGGTSATTNPVAVQGLWNVVAPITAISVDWNTTHYIDVNGNMYGFGFNANGEVGNGKEAVNQWNYAAPYSWDFVDYEDPVGPPAIQVGAGVHWASLFSNNYFCFYKYAMDVNDSVYSWGRNKAMVLGNGMENMQEQYYPNSLDVLVPTMVHPLNTIYQPYNWTSPSISAGANQTVTGTSTTLTGVAKAPLLVKSTAVANNGVDTAGYHIVAYAWTQVSGPATATITSPASASTTVSGMTPGTYVFNLKTTDNNTGTLSSNVTITAVAPGTSAPVASAGSNQTITLPTNSVTLAGSGSETGGTIVSYAWSQTSGPSTASIGSASLATTTMSGLVQGTYIFQLTVTDAAGVTASAPVTVTVNPAAVVPGPPSASAGSNQSITLPTNSVTLAGSGSETNGTIVSYAWSQTSGPSTAVLGTSGSATTTALSLVQGTYTFKLTVTDNSGVTASATVTVTVNPAVVVPGTPVASAGSNQTITLPTSSVTLTGSGSETNGTIVSYAWSQSAGPSTAVFGSAASATTTAGSLVQGVYTFKLTVTDNSGVTASATMTVTVNAATTTPPTPGTPVANAGSNQTITLPTNGVTLAGSGSETNGSIVSYAWSQTSGPSTAVFSNAGQATTTAGSLVQGTYTFKLTVTDNSGVTATATMTVTVNAAVTTPPANAPVANAGSNQTITLPMSSVTLTGSGSEVGGTIVSYAWTQTGGPSTAVLGSAGQAATTAGSLEQGVYTFKLTVTDNSGVTASATVTVTVNQHQPPVANAGPNQTTTETSGVQLNGSASYDPSGTLVAYSWGQLSGLGGVTIANATTATPTLFGLQPGVYVFQLTVVDNAGLSASASVTITVTSSGGGTDTTSGSGTAPVAVTRDTTVYYPGGDTAMLNGAASYAPGSAISAYSWTQVSGPTEVFITGNTSAVGMIAGMMPGNYVFRLRVTNNAGDTASALLTVSVDDNERKANNVLQLYPNPVAPGQQLTITGSNGYAGVVKFIIMDIRGRVIQTVIYEKQAPTFTESIAVSGLARGTYILYVQFYLDQKPQALKFVVN